MDERGEIMVRTIAMPADTNPSGDIFGGWLLSQMDIAGGIMAEKVAQGRVATVAIDAMSFHKAVYVGDQVTCYAKVEKIGNTSMEILVQSIARRSQTRDEVKVTEGKFTFVAIEKSGKPRMIPRQDPV